MSNNATDLFVARLEESGRKVKSTGADSWLGQCPAHDDGKPSLGIRRGTGQVLTYCFAGCRTDDIAAALGLTMPDLFDDKIGVDYVYRDQGKIVRSVHRTPDKRFSQSLIDKDKIVLYNPADVASFIGLTVYIPEGEKDVDTLVSAGVTAVTSPMGASNWGKCDYTPLREAAAIVIVADADEVGEARAIGLRELVTTWGIPCRVVKAKDGKDATDHVTAGHSVDEFVDMELPVFLTEFDLAVEDRVQRMLVDQAAKKRIEEIRSFEQGSKLSPITLEELFKTDTSHDWLIEGLLERRDRLVVTGEEGAGKSVFLRQIAMTLAAGLHPFAMPVDVKPARVLIVDAENTEKQWARSAQYLMRYCEKNGKDPSPNMLISAGVRLDLSKHADVNEVHKLLDSHKSDVLYIGPLYKLVAKEISTDDDAAPLLVALDSFRERGVTLLLEAHAGHARNAEGLRDMRPRGSSALLGWPEFGFGIRKSFERTYDFAAWRGAREGNRKWPIQLMRSPGKFPGELPWMALFETGGISK